MNYFLKIMNLCCGMCDLLKLDQNQNSFTQCQHARASDLNKEFGKLFLFNHIHNSSNISPHFQLTISSFSGQEGGVASRFYLCLHVFPSRLGCTSSTGNKGCWTSIHYPGTWVVAPETENKEGSRWFNGDDVIVKAGTNKKSFAEKFQMMIISSLYHLSYNHYNDLYYKNNLILVNFRAFNVYYKNLFFFRLHKLWVSCYDGYHN